jgi:hypothetical protein
MSQEQPILPPKKHRSFWGWFALYLIVAIIVITGISVLAANAGSGSTSSNTATVSVTPTDTPTPDANAGGPVSTATVVGACGSNCGVTQAPTQAPVKPTPTATPLHPDSSIQEAASGWTHGTATSGIQQNIVWVHDDFTSVQPTTIDTITDLIKLDCFQQQQALWYGLLSVINKDGSTTIIKSRFAAVDITVYRSGAKIAECDLTSGTVDTIDRAGYWTDGDYPNAWRKYDVTSMAPGLA